MASKTSSTYKDELDNLETKKDSTIGGNSLLRSKLAKEYKTAQDALRYMSLDWDEFEDLLFVQARNAYSNSNEISEGSLSSIVIERATRVCSQMPTGVVDALSIQDQGKSLLMNLLLHNYVLPNAGEDHDLETLIWLWDLWSNVYGSMPMIYDWKVSPNYTGPCAWLCPIRNYFPQQGRSDPKSADHVFISTFFDRSALEAICENKDPDFDIGAIQEILDETKNKAVKPKSEDDYLRKNPMFQLRRRAPLTDTQQIELVTKYESGEEGRWITFAPDYDNRVIRNIPNPHKNGKIPVVVKYAMPLIDSPIGLGDMERGRYMQYAMDTTVNLQIDGQKLRTYPPAMYVEGNVNMPTFRFQPGAKVGVTQPNDISFLNLPQAQDNLSMTYQFLKGALNNVLGNSSTQVSAESDAPESGKTPEAIKAQQQSQSTRDEMDTKLLEKAVEELFCGFVELINTQQDEPIELYLFGDEIKQIIGQGYDDIKDMVQFVGKKSGKDVADANAVFIRIKPDKLKNNKGFRYRIDAGSSLAQDHEEQHEQLTEIMQTYIANPMSIETLLNAGGQTVDFPELFKQWFITGGMREWNNILKPVSQGSEPGKQGASNSPQGAQQSQQQQNVSVSLSGKLGPNGLAGAEQQANLPVDQPQPQPQMQMPEPVQTAYQAQPGMPSIKDPDIRQAHAQIMAQSLAQGGNQ